LEEAVNVPGVLGFAAALGTPADLARREGSGKTVMVVGAGPAGLSAAFHLAREGHDCTVLDERETAGGMLLHGPEKLPREVLERDIDFIVAAGVSLRLDTRIAEQRDLERLSEGTDAVVVATGDLGADGAARFGFPSSEPGTAPAPVTGQTARAGFFTAGRGATPGRSVARAVGRGRAVAGAVHQYLVGRPSPRLTTRTDARLGRLTDSERGVLFQGVESRPSCKTDDHDAVRKEAGRCLRCDCAQSVSCRLRALADDYEVEPSRGEGMRRPVEPRIVRDGLSFEPGKCIRCGICVRILENAGITSGLAFAGRGFNLAVVPPFSDPSLLDFKGQARECARLCPTGALVMLREGP
jgi:ferredoxin